jgi:thiamine biosynthesis lipoprotein
LALIVGIICIYIAYQFNNNALYSYSGNAYGTTWSIKSNSFISDKHLNEIKKIITKVDFIASNYKNDSEVAFLNFSDINREIFVSDDLYYLIDKANQLSIETNNVYNITLGMISGNYGFSPTFDKDLSNATYENRFILNKTNKSITKLNDFWFDLSSIAKGYAVDLIYEYLLQNDFTNFFIEIGGEMFINGLNNNNKWNIGISNPENPLEPIVTLPLTNVSIATSGEYMNFYYSNNKVISHTLNSNTGEPINNKSTSVTVINSNSTTDADALATALNAMPFEQALDFSNNNNMSVMFIIKTLDSSEIVYSDSWYDLIND